MDWFEQVNNYCERLDGGYWSEPLNALTNLAFILAAIYCWHRTRDRPDRGVRALVVVLVAIGIGSYLFHTHAQRWSLLADVIPIQLFILLYVHLATVCFFAVPWWAGLAAAALFIPYAAVAARAVGAVFGSMNGSVGYVPVPILIAGYAALLWTRAPATARGMLGGAGILVISLIFRSVDQAVCGEFPLGTHFVWHLLNGAMLGWMILVLHRHRPAAGLARAPRGR